MMVSMSAASDVALILASASVSRRAMLAAAGVSCACEAPSVDEAEIKLSMLAEGAPATAIAAALAEFKAQRISPRHPGVMVIGADQVLECGGTLYDKPSGRGEARDHLRALRGRAHFLHASVCAVRDRQLLWHHNDTAKMEMRDVSDQFIDDYLDAVGDEVCQSVGAYHLEGLGAQLFARVTGDYFTVLGLPLFPLLQFLRDNGVLAR